MSLTAADAQRLQTLLEGDEVAVLPTDTVYGLACNPRSAAAVRRLYELKSRPPLKPSAVMFFSVQAAQQGLPELGPHTVAALRALLPGPVTLLVANPGGHYPLARGTASDVGDCDRSRSGRSSSKTASSPSPDPVVSLGVRVPLFEGPLAALAEVSVPALQSSANLSGGHDPRRLIDVPLELRDGADLALDGGELRGAASTVVDLSRYEQDGSWRIVRAGPVGHAQIERLLG